MNPFANPVFKREFVSGARSWRTLVLVAGYLLMLSVALLALWPSGGVQSLVAEGAKRIFTIFFGADLALTLLLAPAFCATALTYEKENGTWPALFMTKLNAFEILSGKLFASLALLLTVSLLSMPIAALCALTGGVDMAFMLKAIALLLASALSYGVLGLACSSLCRRSTGAILLNYVLILLLAGATWLPEALLSNLLPDLDKLWQAIRCVSPFDAMFYLLHPDSYKTTTSVQTEAMALTPFVTHLLFAAGIAGLSLLTFLLRATRPRKESAAGEIHSDKSKALKRKLSWPFYIFDPLKRKKPIGRFSNPVFVAEMRSKLFANPQFVMRSISAIFIASLGLLTLISFQFGVGLRADTVRMVAIIFQIGVVALLAPGVSSGLVTDEITGGTFDSLRMTPISPFTLIFGKLKATFLYAFIFILSGVFVLLAMAYLEQQELFPEGSFSDPAWWSTVWRRMSAEKGWWFKFWETYWRLFAWVAILLLNTLAFLAGGLFASCVSRTTARATAIAYGFAAAICVATLCPLLFEDNMAPILAKTILAFNPLAAAMQVTSDAFSNYPGLWIWNLLAISLLTALLLAGATFRVWTLFRSRA